MPNDGFRHELVKGDLRKMSPTRGEHAAITMQLAGRLDHHVTTNGLGLVLVGGPGFRLFTSPDTVRAPDIAFVRSERVARNEITNKFVPGAPDLAVEILSPNDTVFGIEEKIEQHLAAGAGMVMVHCPQAAVQTLTENDTLGGQDVVPGFRCGVAEIFATKLR